ncbi:MAG: hypothetical protein Q9199_004023 [Rusavskia elegans]
MPPTNTPTPAESWSKVSRPLTQKDKAQIKKSFPTAAYPYQSLSPYLDLLFEQENKMRNLASNPEKGLEMAQACADWKKDVRVLKELWAAWYVAIVW